MLTILSVYIEKLCKKKEWKSEPVQTVTIEKELENRSEG